MNGRRAPGRERGKGGWLGIPRIGWVSLVLGATVMTVAPLLRADATLLQQPSGYTTIVNAMINADMIRPAFDTVDGGAGRVVPTPLAPDLVRAFANDTVSFLGSDMSSLDPAIWKVDDEGIQLKAIDEHAHAVPSAYGGAGGWRGDILFSEGSAPATLMLVDDAGDRRAEMRVVKSSRPNPVVEVHLMRTEAPPRVVPRAGRVTFVNNAGDSDKEQAAAVANLYVIGDKALLRLGRSDEGVLETSIKINGTELETEGSPSVAWAPVEPGDVISFTTKGRTVGFRLVRNEPVISRYRHGALRQRDPSLASFAKPIEAAMGDDNTPVRTSIRADLQAIAQETLGTTARALVELDTIGSFRAGAVLMDGKTGEIAALPSFPLQEEDLEPAYRKSPRHLRMIGSNSNFVRMVIGSTAKPPLAMAIVKTFPELATLEIDEDEQYQTLLGIDLGADAKGSKARRHIDFTTFLAYSSNEYAATLMLLGLADSGSVNDCSGVQFEKPLLFKSAAGITRQYCRPQMALLAGARPGPNGLVVSRQGSAAGTAWTPYFQRYFCLDSNDTECVSELWRDQPPFARPMLLGPVTPEPEHFGFDVVNRPFADYVMTILGGNRSRWTTISLAQTYARLLTGQAVKARLTPAGAAPKEFDPITGTDDPARETEARARQLTLAGMAAVLGPTGTARKYDWTRLTRTASNGERVALFAKTGTPNVIRVGAPSRARGALQQFAQARCGLRLAPAGRSGRLLLTAGDTYQLGAGLRRAIRAAAAARPECRADDFRVRMIAREIERINADPAALRTLPFGRRGEVTRVPSEMSDPGGEGHAFVLVVARYPAGGSTSQPCHVRVLAANLQAKAETDAENSSPAVDYASKLIDNSAVRAWLSPPCGKAG